MLVSVFAPGGWDALSLLYPIGDPRYHKLRNSLALKPGDGPALRSDSRLHWHPSLKPLAKLHAKGRLTVFPAIGYSHPDQSHFTSRHFWEVGALDPQAGTGWLGRLLDVIGDEENAMQGLSLDGALMPSLATARVPVATLSSPADYGFGSHNVWDVPGELLNDGDRLARGALGRSRSGARAGQPHGAAGRRASPPARPVRRQGRPGAHQSEGQVPGDRFRPPAFRPRRAARRELPDPHRRAHRAGLVRHPRRPAGAAPGRRHADRRGPLRLPGRSRTSRHRGPGGHARVERVRPTRAAERLERHRPRSRRRRLPDGHEGAPAHGRASSRA